MGRRWLAGAALMPAVLALLVVTAAPGLAASPYVVANYPVDASAADAVTAKTQAMAEAKVGAFRYLLKRLVDVSAYRRLPQIKLASIEDMIESVSVRSEENSTTEYVATLDFGFNPGAVRQLLTSQGLPFLDQPERPITVIPAYATPAGTSARAALEGQKAWRQAWVGLDLVHGLTPIKIAVAGPSSTNETLLALAAGDRSKLGVVEAESSAERLIVALATPAEGGKKLSVQLIGKDWIGSIELKRTYSLYYRDIGYTAEFAAVTALGVLEGRWKASQIGGVAAGGSTGMGEDAGLAWSPDRPEGNDAPLAGGGANVHFTVEFASLQQWQDMRSRLGTTPGVTGMEVGALSARGAEVSLAFPGGAAALQPRLAAQGLQLSNAGGRLVLQPAN